MYYRHFNLSGPPFEAASSPEALYLSRAHREGLAALEWGLLHEPSGFTTLTGETGTGKTTLVCSILARNLSQLSAAYVVNPKLSFEDILRVVLGQFGVASEGTTKLDRIEALVGYLGRRLPHERLAIIVDEAQSLSDDVLEELRLLSNYGQRVNRYLQLVLVGQPELAARLKSPQLRQFNQRIAARSVLGRLSFQEAHEYVDYRLRTKGGRSRDIFASSALDYLLRDSCGLPRKINVLCHNAMLLAYSSGTAQVTLKQAHDAVAEYGESLLSWSAALSNPLRVSQSMVTVTGALALLVAVAYGYQASRLTPRIPSQPPVITAARPDTTGTQSPPLVAMKKVLLKIVSPSAPAPKATDDTPIILPPMSTPNVLPPLPADGGQREEKSTMVPDTPEENGRRSISVKYGDTLEKLALKYLGSKHALTVLIDANPQIADMNRIFPGQKVFLSPSAEKGLGAATSVPHLPSQHVANAEAGLTLKNSGSSYATGNANPDNR